MSDGRNASPEVEAIGDRFVLGLLEGAARLRPENLPVLFELGDLLTRLGRVRDGLQVDLRLARLLPTDPTVHYNLACSYSLLGRVEEAFMELEAAIRLGYRDAGHMKEDPDLECLRADPRFRAFLARIEGR